MQAVVVGHLIAVVETPVVKGAHDVEVLMRQRGFTLIEEVDAAIVGLGSVVQILVFHVDEFLAMDVFVGSVGLSSS